MVFVVAEIGVNWNGDFEIVEDMMLHSKDSGCDAVKFQSFEPKILVEHPKFEILKNCPVLENNIEKIDSIAKSVGIEWFSTPMFPQAVDILDSYVNRYKIRVFDGKPLLKNKKTDLLEKILETGKEMIISCESSPKNSIFYNNPQINWLYCVSKYPCSFKDIDFKELGDFDGYSNHCPHIIAPLTAAILGSKIIEIHITSDKSKYFADNSVSFNYQELGDLVDLVQNAEKIAR